MLGFFFPKVWSHLNDALGALYGHVPSLRRPFSASIYPSMAFNCGRQTVCFDHRDQGNAPGVPCVVTAFGDFDHTKGGHLVLFDLKLIIELPSGCSILLPSGALRHGNTRVGAAESRTSFTQYCPGGLLRYVAYGMRTEKEVPKEEKASVLGDPGARWEDVVGRISFKDELHKDRMSFLNGRR